MIKRPERTASGVAKRFGLLALIATVLVALLGFLAPTASASPTFHPQTRVAAIEQPTGQLVAPHSLVLAVQGRERAPNYDRSATGSSVAAEGEGTTFVTADGKSIAIPDDYVASPSRSGGGTIYAPASSTPGDMADAIRVMPATAQYPDGYVIEYDQFGHPVDADGNVPNSRAAYHQPLAP